LLRRKRNIWYPDNEHVRRVGALPRRVESEVGRAPFFRPASFSPGPSQGRAAETTNAPYKRKLRRANPAPAPCSALDTPDGSRFFHVILPFDAGRREKRAREGICRYFTRSRRCVAFLANEGQRGFANPYPESGHEIHTGHSERITAAFPFFWVWTSNMKLQGFLMVVIVITVGAGPASGMQKKISTRPSA
jgi:hypothetical protein